MTESVLYTSDLSINATTLLLLGELVMIELRT